jgi:hypothetical protein
LILGAFAFVLLVMSPEISLLVQPDGTTHWYLNRQVDLPTGDPARFYDYSCGGLVACFALCAAFYCITFRYAPR